MLIETLSIRQVCVHTLDTKGVLQHICRTHQLLNDVDLCRMVKDPLTLPKDEWSQISSLSLLLLAKNPKTSFYDECTKQHAIEVLLFEPQKRAIE